MANTFTCWTFSLAQKLFEEQAVNAFLIKRNLPFGVNLNFWLERGWFPPSEKLEQQAGRGSKVLSLPLPQPQGKDCRRTPGALSFLMGGGSKVFRHQEKPLDQAQKRRVSRAQVHSSTDQRITLCWVNCFVYMCIQKWIYSFCKLNNHTLSAWARLLEWPWASLQAYFLPDYGISVFTFSG